MTLREYAEEYLLYLDSVRNVSVNTSGGYRRDIETFMSMKNIGEDRDIRQITAEDIRLTIAELSKRKMSAASINRYIASVRSLFAYCRKFNYIDLNVALEIKTVKLPKKLPNFLTGRETDAICREPEVNELLWQTRDKALFEVLYSSGCRVSEITGLRIKDLSDDLTSAVVLGKGGKMRRVYFEQDARNALEVYLADRKKRFAGKETDESLFVNQRGGKMTPQGIRYVLSRYSGSEGTKRHVNPHAFRHTFATAMITNGADVRMVQELLGHSSISTTQRYTHISTEQLINLYNKAHPHGGNK